MAGAEPRGAPELRPPSIRGAARYWLRAALAGTYARTLAELAEAETAVFGSTTRASPVSVIVTGNANAKSKSFSKAGGHYSGPESVSGWDYLYWSMAESGKVQYGNHLAAKQHFLPGQTFGLTLRIRNEDPKLSFQALAGLWLMSNLGGIGSRSRRTGGSAEILSPDSQACGHVFAKSASVQALVDHLATGIQRIRTGLLADRPDGVRTVPAPFDILHPTTCSIWIIRGPSAWKTYRDAVEGIGKRFQSYRSLETTHEDVRSWMSGRNAPPTVGGSAFGLPIPYRYSDGPSGVLQGSEHDRRASPLWLKVTRLSTGEHVGVAVLFRSVLLDDGETLKIGRSHGVEPPTGFAIVEDFVKSFPNVTEVLF